MQTAVNHFTTPDFWYCYRHLTDEVRELADKCFDLLRQNPHHPSLRLKKVGPYWSARVGLNYRVLARDRAEDWSGSGLVLTASTISCSRDEGRCQWGTRRSRASGIYGSKQSVGPRESNAGLAEGSQGDAEADASGSRRRTSSCPRPSGRPRRSGSRGPSCPVRRAHLPVHPVEASPPDLRSLRRLRRSLRRASASPSRPSLTWTGLDHKTRGRHNGHSVCRNSSLCECQPGSLDRTHQFVSVGRSAYNSSVWDSVPEIDISADISAVQQWLKKQAVDSSITGIYLGLDTLNEDEGTGKNIEIGFTRDAAPQSLDIEWIYQLTKYGTDHLIRGIYELHAWYETDACVHPDHDDDLQLLLDYIFFLEYSGVILATAIQKERLQHHCLFLWGFHDGDLGPLCRWSPTGFERLANW